jgi:hypothetical protein
MDSIDVSEQTNQSPVEAAAPVDAPVEAATAVPAPEASSENGGVAEVPVDVAAAPEGAAPVDVAAAPEDAAPAVAASDDVAPEAAAPAEATAVAGDGSELDAASLMEQFLNDPSHDYKSLKYGDVMDGVIMHLDREEILVDIGSKSEGIVPSR